MKVDNNDPRPPYVQIADVLRERIQAGQLAAGQRLPSGRGLATEFGVAVMTAQRAVESLRNEGILRTFRGQGTFVQSSGGAAGPQAADVVALRSALESLTRRVEALEQR